MAIDQALMEHLAHLADPGIHVDFGTAQAQRRFTAHGDTVRALAAPQAAVFDVAHLVGIAAPEHLGHQTIIVAAIVPRVGALETVPVVDKDLFKEVPGRRSCCSHQTASLQSVGVWVIALFYHTPPLTSTPSAALTRGLPPPRSPLRHGDFRAITKWKIL